MPKRNAHDVCQRLRELRATVATAMHELERLSSHRDLVPEMRLQLREAATGLAGGADLLTPLPGRRVRRVA